MLNNFFNKKTLNYIVEQPNRGESIMSMLKNCYITVDYILEAYLMVRDKSENDHLALIRYEEIMCMLPGILNSIDPIEYKRLFIAYCQKVTYKELKRLGFNREF